LGLRPSTLKRSTDAVTYEDTAAVSAVGQDGTDHRGRIQAQGAGIEESRSWAQDTPLLATDALDMVAEIETALPASERAFREVAFQKARDCIRSAAVAGGITPDRRPWKKSYPQPPRGDRRRVDLEIWAGTAFVP
jgi:hypothetical protein